MEVLLAVTALCILGYVLFSRELASFGVTMPMVFLALGVIATFSNVQFSQGAGATFHHLAELTLAILLFTDATMLRRKALGQMEGLAARMLGFGLPLAILIGGAVNLLLLRDWPFWECVLLAALLAPTDAALGQSVQSNTAIPERLRETNNAESGLNDGLGFPFVVFFAALAVGREDMDMPDRLMIFIVMQAGIGFATGLVTGAVGGALRRWSARRGTMDLGLDGVLMLALVGSAFFLADLLGGNSFVAVFAAGFAFANTAGTGVRHAREIMETDGQFLAILSFFFIGTFLVPVMLEHANLTAFLVILASILIVRPLAIWLSLLGTATTTSEKLFLGWFGPRGLATALFAVFVLLDFPELQETEGILVVATGAVLVSAFVHGLSARWAMQIFRLEPEVKAEGDDPPPS